MAATEERLNATLFHRRLNRLVAHWKTSSKAAGDNGYLDADVLTVVVGKDNEELTYSKSIALHNWFFDGLELPDTVMVISRSEVIFLASTKKTALLSELKGRGPDQLTVTVIERAKTEPLGTKMDDVFAAIKRIKPTATVGGFPKEMSSNDSFQQEWLKALQRHSMQQVDVTLGVAAVLALKDDDELRDVKHSADATSLVLRNYVIDRLETVIDQNTPVKHADLADEIDKALGDEKTMKRKVKLPDDIKLDLIDSCYVPIIQSGGTFDLRPSATSNTEELHFGTIIVSLGLRYKGYCSNVARTLLINSTPEQDENYKILLELRERVLKLMHDGTKLQDLYTAAVAFLEERKPALREHLVKNLGFGTGLEFRESAYVINDKNPRELKPGMVFNFMLGFQNLTNPIGTTNRDKVYALLVADTVQITRDGVRVLTSNKAALADVSYKLEDEPGTEGAAASESKESKPRSEAVSAPPTAVAGGKVVRGRTRGEEKDEAMLSNEAQRAKHQKELFEQRQRDNLRRFRAGGAATEEDPIDQVRRVEAYKTSAAIPKEVKPNKIFVDTKRDAVILPVFGLPVPFHIAMIKSVTLNKMEDGEGLSHLRINFNTPTQAARKTEGAAGDGPQPTYIRELSFRSNEGGNFTTVSNQIKELIKTYKVRETERREKENLVVQEDLVLAKGRPETLPDVMVRPSADNKRILGAVELHENGIRYRSAKGSRIDIPFSNMRHLIFQPCKTKEIVTILHVRLKHPIMVGNKKTQDVQFFREVVDDTADETGGRRRANAYDQDEIEAEERERRQRKAHDKEFKQFGLKVADKSNNLIELDQTDRELGFDGVPAKTMVLVQPTAHALVHLTELPFMVVTLDDVELASLERVQHGNRNFDLVLIFKDFKRAPVTISTIDMKQLPNLQEFLDSMDIPFAESRMNIKWTQVLKTINEDTAGFFDDGGWKNILELEDEVDAEEGDEEDQEESGSEYEATESEEEEEEDDDSEFDDDEDDEDDDYDEEDEEDDDEGKDWDELEEEAIEEERKRARRHDDEDERRVVKKVKK